MLNGHDGFVFGSRGDFEAVGYGGVLRYKGMIPTPCQGAWQAGEDAAAVVVDWRSTAVNGFPGTNDSATQCLDDGLMSEANAKHRDLSMQLPDDIERAARSIGGTWSRRQDDGGGVQIPDTGDINGRIADHTRLLSQAFNVPRQVVDEAIVVIDQEDCLHQIRVRLSQSSDGTEPVPVLCQAWFDRFVSPVAVRKRPAEAGTTNVVTSINPRPTDH